ncbi:hypothetical protein CAMSH0001_0426 [Campylobacter showae RM3277]|uniref:Uncharacterized protein n=1 Tax=Campylobacter showae RM3277 TaxID=553219 RepID=C6RFC1_9BACT|nr:hypothetical protein CAMSH0001_0426 [Campylobacter showae RM3277]
MLKNCFSFIPCGYYFVAFYLYFEIFAVAARGGVNLTQI